MAGGYGEKSFQETPTWAVAAVCAVFVIISILIEHGIHILEKWFQKRQKKAMIEVLGKIKAELMIMGFISLLLNAGTSYVTKICIPLKLGDKMLPRKTEKHDKNRKLLSYDEHKMWRRALAAADKKDYCSEKGEVSLISYSGLHQIHIFIFVLAVVHVFYSVIIIVLGQAKMKKWKAWELETSSLDYQYKNDPERFRFARQTSFVKRHIRHSRTPWIRWIVSFFRQFYGSISKVDYMAIRNGFINAHFTPNTKFDFHKYIKRSMEDDYKMILGISIPLWFFAAVFLLLDVPGWHIVAWLCLAPIVILLMVGTKLELVIMDMAQQIEDKANVVRGAPVVEPSDTLFWFNRPQWILFLIHFILFQNAFQMALFLWSLYEFWDTSCFRDSLPSTLFGVSFGVVIHILCSYITFPLHALVTQMGSHMKTTIFEEQTARAIKNWQKGAKDKNKLRKAREIEPNNTSNAGFMSPENTPSHGSSPVHLLHKYKSSTAPEIESVPNSHMAYQSDIELSSLEASTHGGHDLRHVDLIKG